jgi:hypothetical protein
LKEGCILIGKAVPFPKGNPVLTPWGQGERFRRLVLTVLVLLALKLLGPPQLGKLFLESKLGGTSIRRRLDGGRGLDRTGLIGELNAHRGALHRLIVDFSFWSRPRGIGGGFRPVRGFETGH